MAYNFDYDSLSVSYLDHEYKSSVTNDSKVYNLNGNRVSNSYKGLKIVKGKKYVEK